MCGSLDRPQTVIFFQNQLFFRPEGVDWWETLPHAPRCEVVFRPSLRSVFHATHRFCSLIREIPASFCFGRSLASLQMNILARTLMDGPTDLNPGRRADARTGVSEFSLQSPHNAQCHGAAVVKFRLFRNAGSSSLMRPGCQSIGTIPEALALPLAFHVGRGNREKLELVCWIGEYHTHGAQLVRPR